MTYVIKEPCIGEKDNSCVEVCPVDAITSEDTVPPEWLSYIEINAAYFKESANDELGQARDHIPSTC